ncbi:MAG: heme/copper-type cytochrome/quinol oxidase, subunit 3 [Nevskia sp.]|nr:heme/copper-type cytochrome/quinol oxidase, subunit 3 [Nevskia sp.]
MQELDGENEYPEAGAESAPALPSIWYFVVADCIGFGIFFFVFMSERLSQAALFDKSSRQLDVRLGLSNTLILITSSWLVALATQATRQRNFQRARRLLPMALLVASGFAILKGIEYGTKISHGISPLTNPYFMFYFVLTGVHFLHYLVGMVVLTVLTIKVRGAEVGGISFQMWMESGGIYWHLVDLLWVFLFPMLYLLGTHS